jgi:hypothetical protein
MSKSLSGVRADHKLSYAKLEKRAEYVREVLGIASDSHIAPAKLFEDLDEISVTSGNVSIPLRGGVIDIEDSEGYTITTRNVVALKFLPLRKSMNG